MKRVKLDILTIWASSKCGKFSKVVNPTELRVKWINEVYFSKVFLWSSDNFDVLNILSRINSCI